MKKKRSEGFFGLHFDFHANADCDCIGENTTPEMIEQIIDIAQPDFIQCDSKGHRGYTSFETKYKNAAPGLTKNALKIWRKVTEEKGVSLYAHYSGVIDQDAVDKNLEWSARNYDGSINIVEDCNLAATSLFGDYCDKLLIPQLKELYDEYKLDGVWVDGECWGVNPDYSEMAKAAYKAETGKAAPAPDKDGHAPQEYVEFIRKEFFNYLRHYTDEIHKSCPCMEIASNWAFSTFIPQEVCADVDFLSGDLSPTGSVGSARHEARYLSKQGKAWDLMSWSFNLVGGRTSKSAAALCQEAAVVIAQGGGYQIYYTQNRDGSVDVDKVQTARAVSEFCRDRQAYCHKWQSIPQVAVLLSTKGCYSSEHSPLRYYDEVQNECKGIMECAIEAGLVVDLVSEHHLKGNADKYAAIIVSEWETIGNRDELIEYAKNGGGLIVTGKSAKIFESTLGVKLGNMTEYQNLILRHNGRQSGLPKTSLYDVELREALPLMENWLENGKTMASVCNIGKGRAVGIYMDFGAEYVKHKGPILRKLLKNAVYAATDKLRLSVEGSENLELTLNEKDGKTAINLINTSGASGNPTVAAFDEIPSVGPLSISFKMETAPKKVTLMPQNQPLKFTYKDGIMQTSLEKLEIYDIIIIE